jgi:hypothetical protein
LKIEQYFFQIQKTVESSPIIRLSSVSYEKRGTHEGIIRGRFQFLDDTILEWREYVDVENEIDHLMYVYQYMDPFNKLLFRYDNTGHHKRLDLVTYPHHKHEGRDDNVVASEPKNLEEILQEIESFVVIKT